MSTYPHGTSIPPSPRNTHPPGTPIPLEHPSPRNSYPPGTPIHTGTPIPWNTHPPMEHSSPLSLFDIIYTLGLPSQHELPRFTEKYHFFHVQDVLLI